jgi:hypothetical protein
MSSVASTYFIGCKPSRSVSAVRAEPALAGASAPTSDIHSDGFKHYCRQHTYYKLLCYHQAQVTFTEHIKIVYVLERDPRTSSST